MPATTGGAAGRSIAVLPPSGALKAWGSVRGERSVAAIDLAPRSAYVLSGEARWSWQHAIPAAKDLRYSVTFRTQRRE